MREIGDVGHIEAAAEMREAGCQKHPQNIYHYMINVGTT